MKHNTAFSPDRQERPAVPRLQFAKVCRKVHSFPNVPSEIRNTTTNSLARVHKMTQNSHLQRYIRRLVEASGYNELVNPGGSLSRTFN